MNNVGSCGSSRPFVGRAVDVMQSLGIVFGDIGTSPLYTLYALFSSMYILPKSDNIIGTVSLIIWTLILVVTIQYAWLAMSLSKKGEGGTIVLAEILKNLLKSKTGTVMVTLVSFLGISLFMGDGVITPAISILNAVEGLQLISGLETLSTSFLVTIAALIAFVLFAFQRHGTERVARMFGPIMAIWFFVLAVSGTAALLTAPQILKAFNPYWGLMCLMHNKWMIGFILAGVVLCATGGEAMYADMGHMGRKPIRQAWFFVLIALLLNYLGQGAFMLVNPQSNRVFHEMIYAQAPFMYVPFLVLCITAAIIASQAMISGVYAVVFQGIMTGIMPRVKIEYTSSRFHAQVYIGFINWLLFLAVLFMLIRFQESSHLAGAYGLAVSGTMVITSTFMVLIFFMRRQLFKLCMAFGGFLINIVFLISSLSKLQQGGYWSLLIAMVPLSIIIIYYFGQVKMHKLMKATPLPRFIDMYETAYAKSNKIKGTGLYFVPDPVAIPSYLVQTMVDNGIIYVDNIMVCVILRDTPYGVLGFFKERVAEGLRVFEVHCGYMEVPNITKILDDAGIEAKAIFFGMDEIVTKNPLWRIYSIIKYSAPTFVRFHKLPPHKIHGVVTIVHM